MCHEQRRFKLPDGVGGWKVRLLVSGTKSSGSMGRCSRRGSLKAAFRWWYQDAPGAYLAGEELLNPDAGFAIVLALWNRPTIWMNY